MISDIHKALISMGYRKPDLSVEKYAKPFGYSVITCEIKEPLFVLTEWHMSCPSDPKVSVWSSKECELGDSFDKICEEIASFEEYSTKEHAPPLLQMFNFLTKKEQAEFITG
jgi:hypothetical protein